MSVNCPAAAEEVRLLLARIIHEKRLSTIVVLYLSSLSSLSIRDSLLFKWTTEATTTSTDDDTPNWYIISMTQNNAKRIPESGCAEANRRLMEVQKSAEQKIHLIETRDAHLWMILLRVVNCPGLLLGFAQIELEFILADD